MRDSRLHLREYLCHLQIPQLLDAHTDARAES